jgi:hypothetical protein
MVASRVACWHDTDAMGVFDGFWFFYGGWSPA